MTTARLTMPFSCVSHSTCSFNALISLSRWAQIRASTLLSNSSSTLAVQTMASSTLVASMSFLIREPVHSTPFLAAEAWRTWFFGRRWIIANPLIVNIRRWRDAFEVSLSSALQCHCGWFFKESEISFGFALINCVCMYIYIYICIYIYIYIYIYSMLHFKSIRRGSTFEPD
jgi:hypothetical protein